MAACVLLLTGPGAVALESAPDHRPDIYILNTPTPEPFVTHDHQGFLDLVVGEAFRRIGERAKVEYYESSKRALINGDADVDHGYAMRVKGMEKVYANMVMVPEPIFEMEFVAYSRDGQPDVRDWETLKNHDVAYILGWHIFEVNLPEGEDNRVTVVKTPQQMFTMLAKNRVDVVLYERWQGLQLALDSGIVAQAHEPPLVKMNLYMYLHKNHAALVAPLARALKAMRSDGTYDSYYDHTLNALARRTAQ